VSANWNWFNLQNSLKKHNPMDSLLQIQFVLAKQPACQQSERGLTESLSFKKQPPLS